MGIETTKYIRKPLYVQAVRVTKSNFDEIVAWCQGEVQQDEIPGEGTGKPYIKVRVHNPKNARQTKAFIGDWLLYTERGYKVYTNKAFHASFDIVQDESAERTIYRDAGTGEITSQAYAEANPGTTVKETVGGSMSTEPKESVEAKQHAEIERSQRLREGDISLRSVGPVAAEPDPAQGVGEITNVTVPPEALEDVPPPVDEVVRHELANGSSPEMEQAVATIEAEGGQVVPTTAEAVAQAVNDNEAARTKAEAAKIAPEAAKGKRVLSEEEQAELGPDGVRELIRAGEAVLAQDLA